MVCELRVLNQRRRRRRRNAENYRIAGNVCEEYIFAVCAFAGIAQTLHPLEINSKLNTCDFACTFQLAMSLLRNFSRTVLAGFEYRTVHASVGT